MNHSYYTLRNKYEKFENFLPDKNVKSIWESKERKVYMEDVNVK